MASAKITELLVQVRNDFTPQRYLVAYLSSQSVTYTISRKTIGLLVLVTYILQDKKQRQKFTGHWHRRSGRSEANYLEWSVKGHLIAGSNKKKVLRWEVKGE